MWVEGPSAEVEALEGDVRAGPPGARVDTVEVGEVEPAGHEGFVQRASTQR